jgi:hypothetical protein
VLLDVARVVAFEAHLDRGSRDGGGDGGVGAGLADSGNIGEDLGVAVHGGVEVKAGEKVLGSGAKGFCATSKGVPLLIGKHVGAMSVVVLVGTVTCTVVEAVEAGGVLPRVRLGVKCGLGVGALKGERSANEGVGGNGLGGELVEHLVITGI